ncbi:MAG: DNA polymerase III subunit beta [Candidatus Komeilibacteria bacterium]|nr:DNA polymerase III subunit beta [Candidatus Komeilibacteria bacterium]
MKFVCTQENFNQGLTLVSHLSSKNTALPILNNILLEAKDGLIHLTATNLEIAITTKIRGRVEKEGSYTIQGKILNEYVKLLPKENIEATLQDGGLFINCEAYQTTIQGLPADDFPVIPTPKEDSIFTVSAAELKQAFNQTLFAVSLDESRAEISGVFFLLNQAGLTLVGTDSFRLAEKKVTVLKSGVERKIIVPLKTCQEAWRILNELSLEETVTLVISENQIQFSFNETKLISRLIEGNYPDYTQIIPKDFITTAKIQNNELNKIIKSASLFCKPGINDVKLTLVASAGEVVVMATNNGVGESLIKIKAEITGTDNEAVFNYRYLLDGLNAINDQEVLLQVISAAQPAVLKPKNSQSYLYIVMPIRQ